MAESGESTAWCRFKILERLRGHERPGYGGTFTLAGPFGLLEGLFDVLQREVVRHHVRQWILVPRANQQV